MSTNNFTLNIKINSNEAFGENGENAHPEVIRILRATADKMESNHTFDGVLHDYNGNKVGEFGVG